MSGRLATTRRSVCAPATALLFAALGFDDPPQPADAPPPSHIVVDPAGPEDIEKAVNAMVERVAKELKPPPPVPIPDDPPPHEGGMIDVPYIIEPPDFLRVEVLEALPGRPISGVRLVRSDGTICLDWYGNVYVRGLTLDQAKAKIILHLRKVLRDEPLGLVAREPIPPGEAMPPGGDGVVAPPAEEEVPPLPEPTSPFDEQKAPFNEDMLRKPTSTRSPSLHPRRAPRSSGARHAATARPRRRIGERTFRLASQEPPFEPSKTPADVSPPAPTVPITLPPGGSVKITIEVTAPPATVIGPGRADDPDAPDLSDTDGFRMILIPPVESDYVFVDIDSYNSKHYYVQGELAENGRYSITGNETVFDAIQFAGGFLPAADPNDIKLIRPGRGGRPSKVYEIDWGAIVEKGDPRANLQLFHGDRIVVGRNFVGKKPLARTGPAAPVSPVRSRIDVFAHDGHGPRKGFPIPPIVHLLP